MLDLQKELGKKTKIKKLKLSTNLKTAKKQLANYFAEIKPIESEEIVNGVQAVVEMLTNEKPKGHGKIGYRDAKLNFYGEILNVGLNIPNKIVYTTKNSRYGVEQTLIFELSNEKMTVKDVNSIFTVYNTDKQVRPVPSGTWKVNLNALVGMARLSEYAKENEIELPFKKLLAREDYILTENYKAVANTMMNVIAQETFNRNADKQFKATAFSEKKNINEETRKATETSPLNDWFKEVEFDNEVDLVKVKEFEKLALSFLEVYGRSVQKPVLRLRKIKNYRALGLYFPKYNNITIDFRDEGTSSLVHEYGHYLDHKLGSKDKSLQKGFKEILDYYKRLTDTTLNDLTGKYDKLYYQTPTEVFARAFEVYVQDKLGKIEIVDVDECDKYYKPLFDIKNVIIGYFDNLLKK